MGDYRVGNFNGSSHAGAIPPFREIEILLGLLNHQLGGLNLLNSGKNIEISLPDFEKNSLDRDLLLIGIALIIGLELVHLIPGLETAKKGKRQGGPDIPVINQREVFIPVGIPSACRKGRVILLLGVFKI